MMLRPPRHAVHDITTILVHAVLWVFLIAAVSMLGWVIGWLLMARYHYGS